jgi:hypothetical protein
MHRSLAVIALMAIAAIVGGCQTPAEVRPHPGQGVGYPSVAEALEALRLRSDVDFFVQAGWTVVQDRAAATTWSFTPPNHPAHPTAVKRAIVERDGTLFVDMSVLCQAEKPACDKLVAEFQELNEKMRDYQGKRKGT